MPGFPRPAPRWPAPFGGRAYFVAILAFISIISFGYVADYGEASATSLGYTVPSGLSEHATLCYPRQSVTESSTPSNTELWIYWITDQNADYCNLSVSQREQDKVEQESLREEVKTLSTDVVSVKSELTSTKEELSNVLKVDESISTDITSLGSESKPLFVKVPISEPSSKVEVADFTSGAQTDLGQIQQNLETVGWMIIGTIIAAMVSVFSYLILRARR